ncbi:MAG: flavodoxin family protein, partial [Candidatus Dormibacteraceae bacterium]
MTELRYDDLKAMFINCTLKRSPEPSNTEGLLQVSRRIMEKHGVEVEVLRAIDHDIATGVWPDMTE